MCETCSWEHIREHSVLALKPGVTFQEVALTVLQRIALEGRTIADREQRTLLRVHIITYKQEIEEQ